MRNSGVTATHGRKDPKTIVFLAAPYTQILDVAGPFQIFVRAAELFVRDHPKQKRPYNVVLASSTRDKAVLTNCGLVLTATETFRSLNGSIDTLLIAGGGSVEDPAQDKELITWLRKCSQRTRRFGSICTGAFLLASAGLLKGKRVTTHWKWAAELARRCKEATVDPDPIFIRDGNIYTSAGITAGMDLALALVEEDLGAQMALAVAREMVLYLRRPGGQSQFSAALTLQASDRNQIAEICAWAVDHLDEDLSVEKLAAKAGMSPRNLARVFLNQTHTTPARFIERLRIEGARRRLEESRDKLEKVATDCGFGSTTSLHRSFHRIVRVSPSNYRDRFTSLRPG